MPCFPELLCQCFDCNHQFSKVVCAVISCRYYWMKKNTCSLLLCNSIYLSLSHPLCLCPSVCLSVFSLSLSRAQRPVSPLVCLSICLSVCFSCAPSLPARLSVCLPACLPLPLWRARLLCLPVRLSVCLSPQTGGSPLYTFLKRGNLDIYQKPGEKNVLSDLTTISTTPGIKLRTP